MKTSERNLWIFVGVVVVVGLTINFFMGMLNPPVLDSAGNVGFEEATRLLRASQNIKARNQAVKERLDSLESKFYSVGHLEETKISLLKVVESIANTCNLEVQQKNVLEIEEGVIGVSLEGKTRPDILFRFVHSATTANIGLRIKRFQIHSLPDQKLLSYQIVVISLLIEKGK